MAKNPAAVALGRLGGKKKVPKGFSMMSASERRKIAQAGVLARAAKRRKGKKGFQRKETVGFVPLTPSPA